MVSYFDVFYGGFCTVTVRKKEKLARQKKNYIGKISCTARLDSNSFLLVYLFLARSKVIIHKFCGELFLLAAIIFESGPMPAP